jgi:hypothetical protein
MGKPKIVGIGELLWDVLPAGRRLGGAPVNFAFYAQVHLEEGEQKRMWKQVKYTKIFLLNEENAVSLQSQTTAPGESDDLHAFFRCLPHQSFYFFYIIKTIRYLYKRYGGGNFYKSVVHICLYLSYSFLSLSGF